jgi:2-hydroxyacyl-CoA lyase 1
MGFMTGRPGLCLAVSGPGMMNCISGLANAMVNKWPMILVGGANDTYHDGKGAFQEFDQMACAKPVVKYSVRVISIKQIPFVVERATKLAMYGTPGPVYIELPADVS